MRTRSITWGRPQACVLCQVRGLKARVHPAVGSPPHISPAPLIQLPQGHATAQDSVKVQYEHQLVANLAGAAALHHQGVGYGPQATQQDFQAFSPHTALQQLEYLMAMVFRASSKPPAGAPASPSSSEASNSGVAGSQQQADSGNKPDPDKEPDEDTSLPVRLALSALAFYRSVMSPMMAPSCRYLPTCSEYSIESYKRYGVWRGTVLTAWRLLRCSPLGSSGYDPPKWPPPGLALLYGEGTWEYGPQLTVVLGTWLFVWIASELLSELAGIFGW